MDADTLVKGGQIVTLAKTLQAKIANLEDALKVSMGQVSWHHWNTGEEVLECHLLQEVIAVGIVTLAAQCREELNSLQFPVAAAKMEPNLTRTLEE